MPASNLYPAPADPVLTCGSECRRKYDIPARSQACVYCSVWRLDSTGRHLFIPKGSSMSEEITAGMRSLPETCTLPDQHTCTKLVELCFGFLHDRFYSLLH
ncbi:hypothetical protein PDIG_12620 [Penicillium digitatum PHI26]|uniref:Uncharacterized protein n=2 Tax=Penicillium digitatum TaxID=36651 RepID=K9G990_PEND2|nr:hypothetical protein PDIP_38840 [Penicillium digitatum Pd1]EKV15809.1 hypothetical protein PDIP_38840 [Penicillium digitatum Pd1]EKV17874.1 hypothetical protein PDIG_12620 [Penicillium digitatum PHI26]